MNQKNNATIFMAYLPLYDQYAEDLFNSWVLELKKMNIDLFNKIERGDFLVNSAEHGYRSMGLYMFDKNMNGDITICNLESDWDSYGTIPRKFELITQFKNPEYWMKSDGNLSSTEIFTFCGDTEPHAYMHNVAVYIPFRKLHDYVTLANDEDEEKYGIDKFNTIKISYEGDIYFVTDDYFHEFYCKRLNRTKSLSEDNDVEEYGEEEDNDRKHNDMEDYDEEDEEDEEFDYRYIDNEDYDEIPIKWINGTK
jgi:hypothetical protein